MGSIIRMVLSSSDISTAASVNVDIPMNGILVGVSWAVRSDMDADGDTVDAELSFISSNMFVTHDARGVIDDVRLAAVFTTSGHAIIGVNKYVVLPDIPVAQGERIYLHGQTATAQVTRIIADLHFNFNLSKRN